MKSRLVLVLLAAVLAALSTAGAGLYIKSARLAIEKSAEAVPVLVADGRVSAGTPAANLITQSFVRVQSVPRRFVAEDAIDSPDELKDQILISPLSKGEQLTRGKLGSRLDTSLDVAVPPEMLAVSVPADEITGVSGALRPGHRVDVMATFTPGPSGADMTRIILRSVLVVSSSAGSQEGSSFRSGATKKNVTLAVTPSMAEKLVFAAEKGHLWFGLRAAKEPKGTTGGQTVQSIFK